MGNLEKGHSEAARPTQAVGWPHLFLAVPLKAVRATGGSSRQPPRCWSTVGGQRLPPPPEPSQERKGLGKVATPPCIPASQQRLPNWTSSCVATEGRVGRIRDPLSFWGDNVRPYRGWQVQPWVGAFMVRDRRFRGGGWRLTSSSSEGPVTSQRRKKASLQPRPQALIIPVDPTTSGDES